MSSHPLAITPPERARLIAAGLVELPPPPAPLPRGRLKSPAQRSENAARMRHWWATITPDRRAQLLARRRATIAARRANATPLDPTPYRRRLELAVAHWLSTGPHPYGHLKVYCATHALDYKAFHAALAKAKPLSAASRQLSSSSPPPTAHCPPPTANS